MLFPLVYSLLLAVVMEIFRSCSYRLITFKDLRNADYSVKITVVSLYIPIFITVDLTFLL